mgnify:CR=1 FL=1
MKDRELRWRDMSEEVCGDGSGCVELIGWIEMDRDGSRFKRWIEMDRDY